MKTINRIFSSALLVFASAAFSTAQTTATNFTANDCTGTSHTLFTELDAGKIIVIAWVMPCGSCAAPSLAAYNAVQSFASSHPNTVYFYLVDDVADTPCNTLTTWGNTNAMPNAVKFSNAAIDMADYGTPGMPKIVVLGGSSHTIGYNLNSGVTQAGVAAAIDQFLALGTEELKDEVASAPKVIPNPVANGFSVEFDPLSDTELKLDIINSSGQIISSRSYEPNGSGIQSVQFGADLKLERGVYFVRITGNGTVQETNFIVE